MCGVRASECFGMIPIQGRGREAQRQHRHKETRRKEIQSHLKRKEKTTERSEESTQCLRSRSNFWCACEQVCNKGPDDDRQ